MPITPINATVAEAEPADTSVVNALGLTQTCPKASDILGPVLAEMQSLVPGLVVMAPSDDWANSAPPAIWWTLVEEGRHAAQRQGQAGEPGPLAIREIEVAFLLFGGELPPGTYPDIEMPLHDCDLTETLMSHLENVLQRRLSGIGWSFAGCRWFNAGRQGIGLSAEEKIKLRIPLLREDNPTVHITASQIEVSIGI